MINTIAKTNTIPARKLVRKYRDVFKTAEKTGEPIVVFAENKPIGAIIGNELLAEFESFKETKAILATPSIREKLAQAGQEIDRGEFVALEDLP